MVDCTGVMTTKAFYREILGQLQLQRRSASSSQAPEAAQENSELDGDNDDVTITDAPVAEEPVAPARTRSKRQRRSVDPKETASSDSEEEEGDGQEHDDGGDEDGNAAPALRAATQQPPEQFNTLNFLSFVKALRICMDRASTPTRNEQGQRQRTLYIALDHVDRLLSRGLSKLITCLLAVNDQLDFLHALDVDGAPWTLSLMLITRAVSLDFDLFVHTSHPAFIQFPAYSKEEIAMIVAHNIQTSMLRSRSDSERDTKLLRRWLVYMYDLLPQTHNDWLEFQHVVVQAAAESRRVSRRLDNK
ncbi:hypothetical protein PINS_up014036 [Pythium insidiosum]|nr:hypothetical protein PINS_up014036 [Pythium insidiosum]